MENRHAAATLQPNSNHIAIRTDGERSRKQTPRGRQGLGRDELGCITIRICVFGGKSEGSEGVGNNSRLVLRIRVLDVFKESGVAVGDDELRGSVPQIFDCDFRGRYTHRSSWIQARSGAVGPDGFSDGGED